MALKPDEDYFEDILNNFIPLLSSAIATEMKLGFNITLENARQNGIKTKDSGLIISQKDLDNYLNKLVLNLRGANKDLSKAISNAVFNNISNRGSNKDLAGMIKDILTKDNPNHFNYKNRYRTIARDQSSEILNLSGWNKAIKLNAKSKYISSVFDSRRCPICTKSEAKYGSEEKAIPMDEDFIVEVRGKIYQSSNAKFHIECRCLTLYKFD